MTIDTKPILLKLSPRIPVHGKAELAHHKKNVNNAQATDTLSIKTPHPGSGL